MSPAPLHLAGHRVMLDPLGGAMWPETGTLVVADLHLEKGTACARRGQLVPPWDTAATLDRLALLLRRYRPRQVVALGDSFHDLGGPQRMTAHDAARLRALTDATPFIWILGNHDPAPPEGIAGLALSEWTVDGLTFRHEAKGRLARQDGGELCGHHHPKACVETRAGRVTRPCFVSDGQRLMLPALGVYAGGLDVGHRAIARLFPRGGRAFLLGQGRLFSFTLAQLGSCDTDVTGTEGLTAG